MCVFLNIYTSLSYLKLLPLKWKYKSRLFIKKKQTPEFVPLVLELEMREGVYIKLFWAKKISSSSCLDIQ